MYLTAVSHINIDQQRGGHLDVVRHEIVSLLNESPGKIGEEPDDSRSCRDVGGLLEKRGDHEGKADGGEAVEEEEDEDDRGIRVGDDFAAMRPLDAEQQRD